MPHKCTKCKKSYSHKEKQIILHGCSCGSKRFFYVKNGKVKNVECIEENEIGSLPQNEPKAETAECANVSCAARNMDDRKLSIDSDESLKDKISVSELEEGKYAIDIVATAPHGNGKKK